MKHLFLAVISLFTFKHHDTSIHDDLIRSEIQYKADFRESITEINTELGIDLKQAYFPTFIDTISVK